MKRNLVPFTLNESSYTNFLTQYTEEIEETKEELALISADIYKGIYSEDEVVEALSRLENIYDPEVVEAIAEWVFADGKVSASELANLGIEILNKHGTEMQMVLEAIAEFSSELHRAKRKKEREIESQISEKYLFDGDDNLFEDLEDVFKPLPKSEIKKLATTPEEALKNFRVVKSSMPDFNMYQVAAYVYDNWEALTQNLKPESPNIKIPKKVKDFIKLANYNYQEFEAKFKEYLQKVLTSDEPEAGYCELRAQDHFDNRATFDAIDGEIDIAIDDGEISEEPTKDEIRQHLKGKFSNHEIEEYLKVWDEG